MTQVTSGGVIPDTTAAVEDAIETAIEEYRLGGWEHGTCYSRPYEEKVAKTAIFADRAELARQGFVIVPAERFHALERWHAAHQSWESKRRQDNANARQAKADKRKPRP